MKLLKLQLALFSNDLIQRPDLLLNNLNSKMNNIFDDIPNIINLPIDAPAEIPVAQTKSKNGVYSLNISRNRVDFSISPVYELEENPLDIFKSIKQLIEKYSKEVLSNTIVGRVGLVITLFENISYNSKAIFEKYFKEMYSNGYVEAALRVNKQTLNKGIVYNNILSLETADIQINNAIEKGVIFIHDINNAPQENLEIGFDIISNVLLEGITKLKPNALKELI